MNLYSANAEYFGGTKDFYLKVLFYMSLHKIQHVHGRQTMKLCLAALDICDGGWRGACKV